MVSKVVRLADGRRISYQDYGAVDGLPVFGLHGTPGSVLKFAGGAAAAHRFGVRLIGVDRWGYGKSDVPSRPSLELFASDVGELADALGLKTFSLLGVSGGGPYAVACASVLRERVNKLALAGPVGDVESLRGFSLLHRFCFGWLVHAAPLVGASFFVYRAVLAIAPARALGIATLFSGKADKALVCGPVIKDQLVQAFRYGLHRGVSGPMIDIKLFGRGLGRLPETSQLPAAIWYGTEDRHVPIAGIERLARRLPQCTLKAIAGEGHFWITRDYDAVLDWLTASGD